MSATETVEHDSKSDGKMKSKLKVPNFIKKMLPRSLSPSKLSVDAVAVSRNALSPSPSPSDREQENRLQSIDPWQNLSTEVVERSASPIESQLMPAAPLIVSPNANHVRPYALANMNNQMAVHNVEVQNNYNFSQINGLHIGNVNVHQAKGAVKDIPNGGKQVQHNALTATAATVAPRYSKSIKELLHSTELLEYKTLHILAKYMGSNWRCTMRALGFTEPEIAQKMHQLINLDDGVYEINYQFLLEWSRNDDDGTVGKLCTFLWKNEQRECVAELKNYLKRERTQKISESSTASGDECKATTTITSNATSKATTGECKVDCDSV